MKTRILTAVVFCMLLTSCNKSDDNEETGPEAFNAENARITTEIDGIADDVTSIVEEQYNEMFVAYSRVTNIQTLLPACADVEAVESEDGESLTTTITFGEGCALDNGNVLSGSIIITGSTNFDTATSTLNYTFEDFYHNGRHIEGTRNVVFTLQSTELQPQDHVIANVDMDFTVTYPNGNEYKRSGHRIREIIQGHNTIFNWTDNVYSVTGNWTTTFPTGGLLTTTIEEALTIKMTCAYIPRGTLKIASSNNSAVVDYGDGSCDNEATLSLNGGAATPITLGN